MDASGIEPENHPGEKHLKAQDLSSVGMVVNQ